MRTSKIYGRHYWLIVAICALGLSTKPKLESPKGKEHSMSLQRIAVRSAQIIVPTSRWKTNYIEWNLPAAATNYWWYIFHSTNGTLTWEQYTLMPQSNDFLIIATNKNELFRLRGFK